MIRLLVRTDAGRMVFAGPVTGRRYEYVAKRDEGQIEVASEDVPGLLDIKIRRDCGCTKEGGQSQVVEYNIFSLEMQS